MKIDIEGWRFKRFHKLTKRMSSCFNSVYIKKNGLRCCHLKLHYIYSFSVLRLMASLNNCFEIWITPKSLIQKNRFFSFQATEMLLSYKIKNISPNILNTNSRHSLRLSLIWKLVKCVDPTHQATALVFLINSIMKTLQLLKRVLKNIDIDIAK